MQPARLHSALHRNQFAAHRPAHLPCITAHRANATSPRASHRIANNPRTVQRAARTDNQPVEVRVSHPVQRPRIALRGPHASQYFALVSFRLVRGTNFSKIQYIYIFIFQIFMAHPSYWLRCENLICGPRFDSGTSRVIVVGPRRRPCCNDDFTTAEK
jgi:hypothetical protein